MLFWTAAVQTPMLTKVEATVQHKPLASRSVVVAAAPVVIEILPEAGPGGVFGLAGFPPLDAVVAAASGVQRFVSRRQGREGLVVRVSLEGKTLWERSVQGRAAADAAARDAERALSQGGVPALSQLGS